MRETGRWEAEWKQLLSEDPFGVEWDWEELFSVTQFYSIAPFLTLQVKIPKVWLCVSGSIANCCSKTRLFSEWNICVPLAEITSIKLLCTQTFVNINDPAEWTHIAAGGGVSSCLNSVTSDLATNGLRNDFSEELLDIHCRSHNIVTCNSLASLSPHVKLL